MFFSTLAQSPPEDHISPDIFIYTCVHINQACIKITILEENFKWHLKEAFASELFIYIYIYIFHTVEVNGVQSCFVFHRRQSYRFRNMRESSLIMIIFVPFSTVSFDLNELLNIQTVFIICIMIQNTLEGDA